MKRALILTGLLLPFCAFGADQRLDGTWVGTETVTQLKASAWIPNQILPPTSVQATIAIAQGGTLVGKIGGMCPGRFQHVWWKADALNFDVGHCKFTVVLSPDGKTLIEKGNVSQVAGSMTATHNPAGYRIYQISGTFHRQ